MQPRAKAIAVLEQAREYLADRLAERVIESTEEILDEAQGDSYMNEIESLYDQIGSKLVHLGQMLSHLPGNGSAGIFPGGSPSSGVSMYLGESNYVDAVHIAPSHGASQIVGWPGEHFVGLGLGLSEKEVKDILRLSRAREWMGNDADDFPRRG